MPTCRQPFNFLDASLSRKIAQLAGIDSRTAIRNIHRVDPLWVRDGLAVLGVRRGLDRDAVDRALLAQFLYLPAAFHIKVDTYHTSGSSARALQRGFARPSRLVR